MSNVNNDVVLGEDIIKELTDFQNYSEADNFDYRQIDLSLFCETTLQTNFEADSIAAGENPSRKHQFAVNKASLMEGTQACLIVNPTNVSSGYSSSSQMDQSSIVTSWVSHRPTESSRLDIYTYRLPLEKEFASDGKVHKDSRISGSQQVCTNVPTETCMYPVPVAQPRLYGSRQIYTTGVRPATSMYSFPFPTSCFLPSRPSVTPSLSTGSIDQRPIDPLVKPSPIPSLHSSGASFVVQPEASLSSQQSTFASASVPTFFSSVPSINSSEMPQIIKEDQSESNRPKKLKTCRRHEVTCPTCSIVLASRGHLMQHMKSHNSVKPSVSFEFNAEHKMTCPTCGLVVATKGHLKQHIRSHSTSTSNRCYKCNCTFTQRSKLSSHLLRAHGISFKRVRAIPQG